VEVCDVERRDGGQLKITVRKAGQPPIALSGFTADAWERFRREMLELTEANLLRALVTATVEGSNVTAGEIVTIKRVARGAISLRDGRSLPAEPFFFEPADCLPLARAPRTPAVSGALRVSAAEATNHRHPRAAPAFRARAPDFHNGQGGAAQDARCRGRAKKNRKASSEPRGSAASRN
jgi:hypothetical protein